MGLADTGISIAGSFEKAGLYQEANYYIDLKNLFRWNGTIILMRIPIVLPDDFNYIDYLE
jgi:hypothetical protein